MVTQIEPTRLLVHASLEYASRMARNAAEVTAAQALRFAVFNLELNEGLAESFVSGLDADPFDEVCDHLLVEHIPSQRIVGTYRLQTGKRAGSSLGYYSEQEFDFSPYEARRDRIVELGRACVDRHHRNLTVLGLLWRGIAHYCGLNGGRFLVGCSSLSTQSPAVGASMYSELHRNYLAHPSWRTAPLPQYECPLDELAAERPTPPKLLRAYLAVGAKICGPPALDRKFKTIDFLTLLDLESLSPEARKRFLS